MSQQDIRRYRFGPLERRGLIGSLRPIQVIAIASSLLGAVVLLRTLPNGAGAFAALALVLLGGAFCFWPIAGRSADDWLPVVTRYGRRAVNGGHRYRSPGPAAGVTAKPHDSPEPAVAVPATAQGLELLAAPCRGESVGVVKDRRTRSYTAVLAVKVTSFGLLDRVEQEARQSGWGSVLAGL